MHLRTALLLLLMTLGLGGLVLWQLKREEQAAVRDNPAPLVPGLTADSITSLRIDNLERGLQMRLEPDGQGGWRIEDPISYPADGAVMKLLLDALVLNRGEPYAGASEPLHLDPPRVVIEIEQPAPAGSRLRRLEVGAVDIDPSYVYVRVDGRLLRTARNLDNALERDLPGWRDPRLLGLSPGSILELHRSGRMPPAPGAEPEDMTLDATSGGGWRATAPFQAALAPEAIGTLLTSLAYLRISGFEDDAPGPLESYGLEPPPLRIELSTVQGVTVALRFAPVPGSDRLRCLVEGSAHVVSVAREDAAWLLAPAWMLVDVELVRAPRESIRGVRLLADGRETKLERQGVAWFVSASGGPEGDLRREKAESGLVSDLLGRIEAARVLEVLPAVSFPQTLVAQGIYVTADGEEHGGEIGPSHASARGTQGLLFRRKGDTLVGLVDESVLGIARTEPRALRSAELHKVAELDVIQAHVRAPWAKVSKVWARNDAGRWTPEGSRSEARDFAKLVDRLLSVRAVRFLESGEDPAGSHTLEVALVDKAGASLAVFALTLLDGGAQDPGAARVLYDSGERRAVVDGALYFPLRELLGVP